MSARRALEIFGGAPLRQQLFFGRGMCSDDTEHTCMVAQSLIAAGDDPLRFRKELAWRLRWWLLGLPAGVGWGTLRGLLKLWIGGRSGVNSAGNGPAMRAAIIGASVEDIETVVRLVHESTALTHRHRLAEVGARVVAIAAWYAKRQDGKGIEPSEFFEALSPFVGEQEMSDALMEIGGCLSRDAEPRDYADLLRIPAAGVSGYVMQTVPIAIYCWLRRPTDFRGAVESAVLLGGDTDTVGAIVGALVGAAVGAEGIPAEWLDRIIEWPRSVCWMRKLAVRVGGGACRPLRLFWPTILARNLFFMVVVLVHGLRRLLPPY